MSNLNYVSTVYTNLIEPIAVLYEEMVRRGATNPTEVQAAPTENGYAISIIALNAFLMEGVCGRTRYLAQLQGQHSVSDTLRSFGRADLADKLDEVFVVRDVIAHSHLWTGNTDGIKWITNPVLLPGYGDGKFKRLVDLNTRTTHQLKLDVFPPRIHRVTATIVIRECASALQYLQSKDRNYVYLDSIHVPAQGKLKRFYRWADELPR
jgi:hypothetical protein